MSGRLNSLPAELRRVTLDAREAEAKRLYGLEALRDGMTKAAGEGQDHHLIDGRDGLDLRTTAAAKAATVWLTVQRIEWAWRARPGSSGGEDGVTPYTLVLSWKKTAAAD